MCDLMEMNGMQKQATACGGGETARTINEHISRLQLGYSHLTVNT